MSLSLHPVRIGVVGYGFGQFHVRALANMPEAQLVAVADNAHGEALEQAAGKYGFAAYDTAAEMMRRERLDAISVCVSPKYRRKVLTAGVEAGLAMFIEKPWASNSHHARELADICRQSRRAVMVGFSFRFHPAIVRLRQLLVGELGRPRLLSGQYVFGWLPGPDNWVWDADNGNGFINENSCHMLDAVCSLMGRPTRVFAESGRFAARPGEDSAAITIRFAEGGIASLACGGIGSAAASRFPRIDLFAENGQAELLGRNHVWQELRWILGGESATRELAAPVEQLGETRYTPALRLFLDAVRDGAPAPATVDEGVLAVDLAMAIVESGRSGRAVELQRESKE